MKIKEILAKIAKGETLTDAEKEFLAKYEEPTTKDDKTVEALKKEKEELEKQKAALEKEKEDAENAKLSEADKAKKEYDKIVKERDTLKAAKEKQDFDLSVSSLANEHKFTDLEYLKYLVNSRKVDVAKGGKDFMENLKKEFPKYFSADVNTGGADSQANSKQGGGSEPANRTTHAEFLKKEKPTAVEALQAMKRAMEIKAEEAKAAAITAK